MDEEKTLADRVNNAVDVWSRRPKLEWLDYESEDLLKQFAKMIQQEQSVPHVVNFLEFSVVATNMNDEYSHGMRNGLRLAIASLTGEKPDYD